jgi:hypothetical protein
MKYLEKTSQRQEIQWKNSVRNAKRDYNRVDGLRDYEIGRNLDIKHMHRICLY